ncbi:MAG: hypothetical protein ACI9OD_000495 [Limisphaerales bacterium]|jgi:hypothetical protein
MVTRTQHALKLLLATALAFSVLAAGTLVHLPGLHAELHCEGASYCCSSGCQAETGHEQGSGLPDGHQCLIELLAAGCADVPVAIGFVPLQFVVISEVTLLEHGQVASGLSSSAIPGRAPPVS